MNTTALNTELLATFVAVADEASFSKAARRLGVSKGTVSRAIQRLETVVGAELLHRTTHVVTLSTTGAALYERAAPHLRALHAALGTLPESAAQPSGELRIASPSDFGTIVLPELVAQFSLRYPAVRFDLHLDNAAVDLVAERFDLAIRGVAGKLRDSTLTARKLVGAPFGVYASPAYIARRGSPLALGDPKHDWVTTPSLRRAVFSSVPDLAPRSLVNDLLAVRELLSKGLGVGVLPRYVAEPALLTGNLVRVLPSVRVLETAYLFIVYPSSGQIPRKVAAFRDFLLEHFKARSAQR